MSKDDFKKTKGRYNNAYKKYKTGLKSLRYSSYAAAFRRYKTLLEGIDFHGMSILDVGCGFGDILPYIFIKTEDFDYLGVDSFDSFVEEARNRYPGENLNFQVCDYFSESLEEAFDVILCCGALSGIDADLEFRKKAIELMFDKSSYVLAFNMAGHFPALRNNFDRQPNILHVDAWEILNFCFSLTDNIEFKQNYNQKDFTIIMRKPF